MQLTILLWLKKRTRCNYLMEKFQFSIIKNKIVRYFKFGKIHKKEPRINNGYLTQFFLKEQINMHLHLREFQCINH